MSGLHMNKMVLSFYLLQLFHHYYPNWNIPRKYHFEVTGMSRQVAKTDQSNAKVTTLYRLPKGTTKNS